MVNLLIETDSFDKGGVQKVILDLAQRLDQSKFNIFVVSINKIGYLAEVAIKEGIKVVDLSKEKNKIKAYRNFLIENNINLTCSHYSNVGYKLFGELHIPNITYIHNVYAFLPQNLVEEFKENDKYVDVYISVSSKATDYAVAHLGVDRKKVITIPNGLIIEEHLKREKNAKKINRSEFGLSDKDYVFLNVASYNLHKGHYLMMDAMRKILKTRDDIKILCVGNVVVEAHYEQLVHDLKDFGLDKYMLLPGFFPNVESFYGIVDAFLLPSFIEGWSIAMTEAMFYEKPLILTDTGGSSDVIENNDIGILIPNEYGDILNLNAESLDKIAYEQKEYKTSTDLAKAMINFTDNKEKWNKAGKLGRKKVLEKYDLKKVVEKTEEIYLNILKK